MSASQVQDQQTPSIDPSKPKTWETTVKQAMTNLDEVVKALLFVAKDENRSGDDRIAAILLLGSIGTQECVRFLVDNVALRADPEFIRGGGDMMKLWPCTCALGVNIESNWNIAHAVLKKIGTASDDEINMIHTILRVLSDRKLVINLLDYNISISQDAGCKRRYERVKQSLQNE